MPGTWLAAMDEPLTGTSCAVITRLIRMVYCKRGQRIVAERAQPNRPAGRRIAVLLEAADQL